MKTLTSIGVLCALALLLTIGAGCVAIAAGAGAGGTVAYIRGDLEATLEADVNRATTASEAAIKELGFALVKRAVDTTGGEVIARTAQDKKVSIELERASEKVTNVRIRVGTFGDEERSQLILETIQQELR